MEDTRWKTALWNLSWKDLEEGKYNTQGNCRLSKTGRAILEIPLGDISYTRVLKETGQYSFGLESPYYDHLYGFTQDGVYLVLNDVVSDTMERSFPGGISERLIASTVLSSRHKFDPDTSLSTVDLKIEGLRDWMQVSYNPEINEGKAEISCTEEVNSLIVYKSNRCTMEIRCGIEGLKSGRNGISASTFATVRISYTKPAFLSDLWTHDVSRFQSFLAFCFGSYPPISEVSVKFDGNDHPVDVQQAPVSSEVIRRNYRNVPIPFSLLKDILPNVVTRWMNMEGDEFQACKMLTSLFNSWDMPIDLKLFAATSMLESLERARCNELFTGDELSELIAPMLEAADKTIRNRAQGLLNLLRWPSYRSLLDAAYTESEQWGANIVPNWGQFKKVQIKLRNAGAHALDNGGEFETMVDHYDAQILLAYIIVMRRLCLPDVVLDQFEDSNFMNVSRWRLKKRYAASESSCGWN